MEETAMEATESKQEYKKLQKLLKKAYKASVKANQLEALVESAKKNFPGYITVRQSFNDAPRGADTIKEAAFKRVEANFYEKYAGIIDKYRKKDRKASTLRTRFSVNLFHAGKKESEEE